MLAQRRWSFEEYAMMQHGSFEVVEDAAGARGEVAGESARVQEEVQVDGMQAQIQLKEGIQSDQQRFIFVGEQLADETEVEEGILPDQSWASSTRECPRRSPRRASRLTSSASPLRASSLGRWCR